MQLKKLRLKGIEELSQGHPVVSFEKTGIQTQPVLLCYAAHVQLWLQQQVHHPLNPKT